ncbi:carboxypeptidase C [Mycena amicta]|nr:carboxypeptidase C [Mycena amicta]
MSPPWLRILLILCVLVGTNATIQNDYFWAEPLRRINGWLDASAQYFMIPDYGDKPVDIIETSVSRVTVSKLCEPNVLQYSGYFDITPDKHMFFRFFESRSSPSTDPLVLWLQGGPGDSSAVGLLFELGPCSVVDGGRATRKNPHSWTNFANIIFLDQPIDVGFSYSDSGTPVRSNVEAATDVYLFLQLFLAQFPEYSTLPFHVAGESYGGIYAPNVASLIWHANQAPSQHNATKIRLESVILANGISDPYIQIPSIVDYVCLGPFALFSDPQGPECTALRSSIPMCQRLIRICNWYPTQFTCGYASRFCRSRLFEPSMKSDLNWYDLRKTCNTTGIARPEHCYEETPWVETYMRDPKVKRALGIDPERSFHSFNMDMNRDFNARGEGVQNAAKLLPELIDGGVRLLVYAGNADMMANYMGNERWVENLNTQFKTEFATAESLDWVIGGSNTIAGTVRSAGAGNLTFVTVYEAGHMVSHDQPVAALDLFTRWIRNVPLALVERGKRLF